MLQIFIVDALGEILFLIQSYCLGESTQVSHCCKPNDTSCLKLCCSKRLIDQFLMKFKVGENHKPGNWLEIITYRLFDLVLEWRLTLHTLNTIWLLLFTSNVHVPVVVTICMLVFNHFLRSPYDLNRMGDISILLHVFSTVHFDLLGHLKTSLVGVVNCVLFTNYNSRCF